MTDTNESTRTRSASSAGSTADHWPACSHVNYRELSQEDGWPGGDIVTAVCLNCGEQFRFELPQ